MKYLLWLIAIFCLFIPPLSLAEIEVMASDEPHERAIFTDEVVELIEAIANNTAAEARKHLPMLEEDIYLELVVDENVIPSTGELGIAMDTNRIRWVVSPHVSSPKEVVNTHLHTTLLHEMHHLARSWTRMSVEYPIRIIDAAIAEGLASVFQRDIGGDSIPWGRPHKDIDSWVSEILALENAGDYEQWMFEHNDGRKFIGYQVGTYLVDKAMKNTGKSAADMVLTPTDDILKFAGYKL